MVAVAVVTTRMVVAVAGVAGAAAVAAVTAVAVAGSSPLFSRWPSLRSDERGRL